MAAMLEQDVVVTHDDDATLNEKREFAKRATRLAEIPLSLIQKSESALRGVQRQSEAYLNLFASVKQRGVLNSITVREEKDPVTGVIHYMLIDGLQRFTAATDAGLQTIPANIVAMDDAELLEAQLITNLQKIQTKPAEVSKHLLRILARNPYMTKQQLAERVCQSLTWVDERLSLSNLLEPIKELVNNGRIHLTNAYILSKLPQEEQVQFVDDAQTETPKTFVPRIKDRIKALKEARRTGTDAEKQTFQPSMHLQRLGDIKSEIENRSIASTLVKKHNVTDPVDAFTLGLKWALNYDPDSQERQIQEYKAREEKKEAERARIKAERDEKKAREAQEAKASILAGIN